MRTFFLSLFLVALVFTARVRMSVAAEIRVVDAGGLVRAVKVVRGNVRLVISLTRVVAGECVATNVDGLAAEKRSAVSPKGECVFEDVSVGSWQIQVPGGVGWRVSMYE